MHGSLSTPDADATDPVTEEVRAAQYVRMSTEHQKYSIENQSATISAYAALHRLAIVRTYADRGRSGLTLEGRDALRQLIADVQADAADFKVILVYDVSRWGRFQDSDESAYYEYLCRRAGISVHYCAEQFQNDGSPLSAIIKGLKRAMAGEYSRELSLKVFAGQRRILDYGFSIGGQAPYGLQRELLDHTGAFKAVLRKGERKNVQSDRVVLAPGPLEERETVCWMFQQFATGRLGEQQIANALNERGLRTRSGRQWSALTVHQMLQNEKYTGTYVWNRSSCKLKSPRTPNRPEHWLRNKNAFAAIVEPSLFEAAQARYRAHARRRSKDNMLDALRAIYRKHGRVTVGLLDEIPNGPTREMLVHRFGTFGKALIAAGVGPVRGSEYVEVNRGLKTTVGARVLADITAGMEALGARVERRYRTLTVNGAFSIVVAVLRPQRHCKPYWRLPSGSFRRAHFLLLVPMDRTGTTIGGYYLLPQADCFEWPRFLSHLDYSTFAPFRIEGVDQVIELAHCTSAGAGRWVE